MMFGCVTDDNSAASVKHSWRSLASISNTWFVKRERLVNQPERKPERGWEETPIHLDVFYRNQPPILFPLALVHLCVLAFTQQTQIFIHRKLLKK